MQAMLSDARGRVLVVEPGIGFLEESGRFSLIANDSLLARKGTGGAAALGAGPLPGDDRYERAEAMLKGYGETFAVSDGFRYSVLSARRASGRPVFPLSIPPRNMPFTAWKTTCSSRFPDMNFRKGESA